MIDANHIIKLLVSLICPLYSIYILPLGVYQRGILHDYTPL